MGDSVERWRATIGLWSGGRPRKCVTSQHHIAQTSGQVGYKYIRFLVLVSLLVIGCVELNPGPDHETAGALRKFRRRPGIFGMDGKLYEFKMAAFLFSRALNKTEEFRLASNVDGAGAFDDLVFRYRLREPDVWKTCFIQLKYKGKGGTIQRSSLTKMSGDFSLLKYFKSFCKIKNNAATDLNLKQCGTFVDFEFVIYTNGKLESKSPLQGGDSDPVSILSSGTDCGKYIAFDEHIDTDIFEFFEEILRFQELIRKLDSALKRGTSVEEDFKLKIKECQDSVKNKEILLKLNCLQSNLKQDYVTMLIAEESKCDFTLYKEFLSKVKIFQNQSIKKFLKELIQKELQEACIASPPVANFIFTKIDKGFSKWLKKDGNIEWLNENSELWQAVQKHIISEIKEISEPETQEINKCGIQFNEQHVRKLSDVIKQNTVLNIVTESNVCNLQKLRTYQALNILGYKNSIFIGIKSLMNQSKEIKSLWPCKWCDVMVVDCGSDCNVAHAVMDILQQSVDCEQGSDIPDDNMSKPLVNVLLKYQQKLILISNRQMALGFQEELQNISYFKDKCDLSDLDEKSQKKILERTVNFQGTKVALSTLVGTDPPESMKAFFSSDIISILLSNEHELSVGRQLGDQPKYYVPRVLQHQIYLKKDILKLTDYAITFAVSGLQADKLKKYLPAGEKMCEFVYDERERCHNFKMVSDFFNSGFSNELKNKEYCIEAGQNEMPGEKRYIILGNKNPENEFRELKKLSRNVHWIHVEENSFLWKDTNGNIDVIRRYIDNRKCEEYDDMKCVVEHNDRTMLLVAEPGMGKSTFLSYMAHTIKKRNPSVWVIRINLNGHTNRLEDTEFEPECIDKCKKFLWSAAHSPEQKALNVSQEIFLQALKQTGKMVIILDGFDEISPEYSRQVEMLIRTISHKTASKIWISTRSSYRQKLEDMLGKFAFTLQPFTPENQIHFLEKYWTEGIEIFNRENMQMFGKKLLSLCSQNLSDKDGEFTSIPLQTMMLGEAFVNEAKEYCCSGEFNLPEKFNLLSLFKKFTEKKFDIYFREKNNLDTSILEVKSSKTDHIEQHKIPALLYLFSPDEVTGLLRTMNAISIEQAMVFLRNGKAQKIGIIKEITNGKPHFVHRGFAEYFAAKWLTGNFRECEEFISNILFNTTYEVTRNMFDRMLAEVSVIHGSVLNNDIHALKEFLNEKTNINTLDSGGRTALHLAASYNSPCIQQLLSFPGINANKPDAVLEWTPLRYADRTKSWMAMDILLQNGANPEDIVFTRLNAKAQEWGQVALWECASKGHVKLLDFMLNCGIEVNASFEVPDILHEKFTLLHRASYCGQLEIVRFIVNGGADINFRDANNNTALHLAAASGSVNIINLLLVKGMSVNLTNKTGSTPLHISSEFGHLEATKALVAKGAAINNTNIYGNTPLMRAAHNYKLETFHYLTEKGADINTLDANNNTALHYAAESGSVDIIILLLNIGMSVNLTNKTGSTPLHISAEFGHLEATKALVEKDAAINNTNKYGYTPLMKAVQKGKLEIIRYLIERGADINICNAKNTNVLLLAAQLGSAEIMKLVLDKWMSVN